MLIRLTLFAFVCFLATSRAEIKCDFRYSEYQTAPNEITDDDSSKIDFPGIVVVKPEIKGIFDCDDGFEKVPILASRFNWNYDEDDDIYETLSSSCDALRSTIRPSRLSNVKGEMTLVHQSSKFIQEIHIEKCAEKISICEHGQNTPKGFAYVCRQKYVKMTLKAFDSVTERMFDDHFPIPSGCVCEYVRLKEKTQEN